MCRPSTLKVLMSTTKLWSERSTCSRLHVGAVVAHEGRILSTGYNGAPAGMEHCNHECDCGYPGEGGLMFKGKHLSTCNSLNACLISVHAEANAIAFAARHGIKLEGAEIYTTHTPCRLCCMLIINAGLKVVVWETDYDRDSGVQLLKDGNVACGKWSGGKFSA